MRFIDQYFYKPNFWQKILALIVLPISLLYYIAATIRRHIGFLKDFHIPIISVGNLVAGGSGKTPFIIEIAKDYQDVAIISRGYKRKSKGLLIVSQKGKILVSQQDAGDEAYLIAKTLTHATIIVSKKRVPAIKEAKKLGCKIILLDDGFRFNFKKLNILLKPKLEPYFKFCIPSGIYREKPSLYKSADILATEGIDYQREVKIINPTQRMLLVTAIANPSRLDEYLPNVIGKLTFRDHYVFDINYLQSQAIKQKASSLLVTQKDEVKLQDCPIPLSIMQLRLQINPIIKKKISHYIESYA
ncbi:tetraacyldisaccharide 4'-kinase [Helicobacter sp. 11S03491-1]|uniref:tetraacyldisaccharide 4'-kinase n=1 Tax=Helicobacter sp. 11S03491-1 TaxID=1476196 RepID=UPI000BA689EF|nr:tetraacyldisaccharide 4'-kinase [Helicobacter sp. 11S03491-1]PAF41586.1 tetraacyldisaccharide 4'-kinase [Helicobacter sp. 11S03491-1]